MTDISRLANVAENFSVIFVIGGIVFALLQMRRELDDLHDDPQLPAFEAHTDWVPADLSNEI